MKINKEVKNLNMPWEKEYGYSQAVKVGDTIYLSGQVSHDQTGEIVGVGDTQAQIRQAYVNIEKLPAEYGAGLETQSWEKGKRFMSGSKNHTRNGIST